MASIGAPALLFEAVLGRNRSEKKNWRRGGDSNPRYPCGYVALARRCIRPLCHLSGGAISKAGSRAGATRIFMSCYRFVVWRLRGGREKRPDTPRGGTMVRRTATLRGARELIRWRDLFRSEVPRASLRSPIFTATSGQNRPDRTSECHSTAAIGLRRTVSALTSRSALASYVPPVRMPRIRS